MSGKNIKIPRPARNDHKFVNNCPLEHLRPHLNFNRRTRKRIKTENQDLSEDKP